MSATKSITAEIQELRSMSVPELTARYELEFGRLPRVKNKAWLWRRIAWRIQEKKLGGLSTVAKERLDELISELDLPLGEKARTVTGQLAKPQKPGMPPVGTVLTRQWRGTEVSVTVVEGGIEYEGVVHRSLTAAAEAITKSHVSGPRFFGLVAKGGAR